MCACLRTYIWPLKGEKTVQERVQKILAARGVASRRKAEELIRQGRVRLGNRICTIGDTAECDTEELYLDDKPVPTAEKMVYIILNKPRGYVTTMEDEKGRKTVAELVDCGVRVYPVGRLDMDSEGLLLMTNDGALTHRLIHPTHEVEKTYDVWVNQFKNDRIRAMERPMEIDGYRIRPARVKLLWSEGDKAMLSVTIHEGRNRQIRKMAAQCGMNVTRLRRVREGSLTLGKLEKGTWRYLTENEINHLMSL